MKTVIVFTISILIVLFKGADSGVLSRIPSFQSTYNYNPLSYGNFGNIYSHEDDDQDNGFSELDDDDDLGNSFSDLDEDDMDNGFFHSDEDDDDLNEDSEDEPFHNDYESSDDENYENNELASDDSDFDESDDDDFDFNTTQSFTMNNCRNLRANIKNDKLIVNGKVITDLKSDDAININYNKVYKNGEYICTIPG